MATTTLVSNIAEVIIAIEFISATPHYDSEWRVKVYDHGTLVVSAHLTRYDSETAEHLEKCIRELPELSETSVKSLNLRSCIYYD